MRVAFVALSFHLNNTRSSQFFIDILRQSFDDFHVVPDGDAWFTIPRLKPDVLIVWQKIYTPVELECFGVKNIVLIPMYDACPHTEEFWTRYKAFKIFCFSRTLYDFLKNLSFSVFYAQYYSRPSYKDIPKTLKLNAFYWERSKLVNWTCIKSLLGDIAVDSLHYHTSSNIAEANYDRPYPPDFKKYTITMSDWFYTIEDYFKILNECSIYFAARESEGIGLSFIEALSLGLCVIAPDAPTMNEYITNGINGILYDPYNPNPVSLSDIDSIRERALLIAKQTYTKWLDAVPSIIDFIKRPMIAYMPHRHYWIFAIKHTRSIARYIYKKMMRFKPLCMYSRQK